MTETNSANSVNFYSAAWEYPAKVLAEYRKQKEQTMRKPKTLTPDEKLLIALGKKAYFDLKRTSEIAIDAIEEMVARGDSPSQIQSLVIGQFPHLWVESQQIKAVAWYLLQGDIEED